jgi:hypothetical protein
MKFKGARSILQCEECLMKCKENNFRLVSIKELWEWIFRKTFLAVT